MLFPRTGTRYRDICIEKFLTNLEAVLKILLPKIHLYYTVYSHLWDLRLRSTDLGRWDLGQQWSSLACAASGAAGSWCVVCTELALSGFQCRPRCLLPWLPS